MIFYFIFFILTQNSEADLWKDSTGLEITIKGNCYFTDYPYTLMDSYSSKPIGDATILLRNSFEFRETHSDENGLFTLPKEGVWKIKFPGDEIHYPCTSSVNHHNKKKSFINKFSLILLIFGILLLFYQFRSVIFSIFRRKSLKEDVSEDGFVRISSSKFKLSSIFTKALWRIKVISYAKNSPMEGVEAIFKTKKDKKLKTSDKNGELFFEAEDGELILKKKGYKSEAVVLNRNGGEIRVKIITLRNWALLILKEIIEKADPKKASFLTPREAISLKIPPPNLIRRIEKIAFSSISPSEKELKEIKDSISSVSKS